ncbi:DinB family protein [Jannaschia sp. W003]|uniref:DinB family protein n=1 Tax=Jannaschia sp. W003 TaxID=2867012 RepID=UPI0021A7E948|nr:DinB family protein [Jannaschia sp. W003]UWQ20531.1 DinB family protein [Jannaschia sp. W003]
MSEALVTPGWVRMMARYNAWQDEWLVPAVEGLGEDEARRERGAFFGSILGTASHLLWADEVWLGRFRGAPIEAGGIPESVGWTGTVADWAARRRDADAGLVDWAEGLESCEGEVRWWSGVMEREVSRPRSVLLTHLFNHQTHHRGQIHAMLTAAGVPTGTTDLAFMAEAA